MEPLVFTRDMIAFCESRMGTLSTSEMHQAFNAHFNVKTKRHAFSAYLARYCHDAWNEDSAKEIVTIMLMNEGTAELILSIFPKSQQGLVLALIDSVSSALRLPVYHCNNPSQDTVEDVLKQNGREKFFTHGEHLLAGVGQLSINVVLNACKDYARLLKKLNKEASTLEKERLTKEKEDLVRWFHHDIKAWVDIDGTHLIRAIEKNPSIAYNLTTKRQIGAQYM